MFKNLSLIVSLALIGSSCAAGENKTDVASNKCLPIQEEISTIMKSKSYGASAVQTLYKKHQEIVGCDDGFYGEGTSDIVVKSLAQDFSKTSSVAVKDKKLSEFLVRHTDATADWSDLDKVTENTKKHCGSGQAEFCKSMATASQKASELAKKASNQK